MTIASEPRRPEARDEPRRGPGLRPIARFSLELLLVAAAVVVVAYALARVSVAVVPVLLAVLLSAVLRPPYRLLRRGRVPSALAALLVTLGFLAVLGAALAVVIPQFTSQADQLVNSVSQGVERVTRLVRHLPFDVDVQQALRNAQDKLRQNLGAQGAAREAPSPAAPG